MVKNANTAKKWRTTLKHGEKTDDSSEKRENGETKQRNRAKYEIGRNFRNEIGKYGKLMK